MPKSVRFLSFYPHKHTVGYAERSVTCSNQFNIRSAHINTPDGASKVLLRSVSSRNKLDVSLQRSIYAQGDTNEDTSRQ